MGIQLNRAWPHKDVNERLAHAMTSLTQRQVRELQLRIERKRLEAKAAAKGKGTQRKENAQGKGFLRRAAYLVEGAPVHGPQLDGCGSHNGGRPGGLKQQSCVSKHPAGLHVDLDLTTFNLQIKASLQEPMPPHGVGLQSQQDF